MGRQESLLTRRGSLTFAQMIHEYEKLKEKIDIIERVDWIKNELMKLNYNSRFVDTVCNRDYAEDIERIMKVPFRMAKREYLRLINTRNEICHKYTQRGIWPAP